MLLVRIALRLLVFVMAMTCVLAMTAQEPSPDLERILLPIVAEPLGGENGAVWETDVWLMLHDPVFMGPILNRSCLPPCGPPAPPLPPPGEAVRPSLFRTRPGEPHGILLFITRGQSHSFTLSVRVADTSQRPTSAGIAVPVVTERDLRPVIHLLNIDSSDASRVRIRVYDAFALQSRLVRLRVFDMMGEDRLILEMEGELRPPPSETVPGWSFPIRPASAEFTLPPRLVTGDDPLRIEITSDDGDARLWAFATVTNNTTNQVTLVTP